MSPFRSFAFVLFVFFVVPITASRGAEPFLKPNDVVALVGGEDMVAASEYGYLEVLLQRALPGYKLKFRSLAWEGDTVFEQPRELNYPTLEAQLDEVGATVVIMQFGQMESLAGTSKLPEFLKAYEKLIERVTAGGKRRVVVVVPPAFAQSASYRPEEAQRIEWQKSALDRHKGDAAAYAQGIRGLVRPPARLADVEMFPPVDALLQRNGVHLLPAGQFGLSMLLGQALGLATGPDSLRDSDELRAAVAAKNLLWFHYYRPQNWAFLNGDRTEQPSSRDHKDPSKRWFPEEMKQFLSLVEAKEKEIWEMAAKAAAK